MPSRSIHTPSGPFPTASTLPGMSTNESQTVNRRAAAERIGVSPDTLRRWNVEGRGPRVAAKLGTSQQARTLYRIDEIERWKRDPAGYERRHRGPKR